MLAQDLQSPVPTPSATAQAPPEAVLMPSSAPVSVPVIAPAPPVRDDVLALPPALSATETSLTVTLGLSGPNLCVLFLLYIPKVHILLCIAALHIRSVSLGACEACAWDYQFQKAEFQTWPPCHLQVLLLKQATGMSAQAFTFICQVAIWFRPARCCQSCPGSSWWSASVQCVIHSGLRLPGGAITPHAQAAAGRIVISLLLLAI